MEGSSPAATGTFEVVKARPRGDDSRACAEGTFCRGGFASLDGWGGCGFLLAARLAASKAPAAGLCEVAFEAFAEVGAKAKVAPRTAGEGTGETLRGEASCCMNEGFGATGGRRACFSVINPLTPGLCSDAQHQKCVEK